MVAMAKEVLLIVPVVFSKRGLNLMVVTEADEFALLSGWHGAQSFFNVLDGNPSGSQKASFQVTFSKFFLQC